MTLMGRLVGLAVTAAACLSALPSVAAASAGTLFVFNSVDCGEKAALTDYDFASGSCVPSPFGQYGSQWMRTSINSTDFNIQLFNDWETECNAPPTTVFNGLFGQCQQSFGVMGEFTSFEVGPSKPTQKKSAEKNAAAAACKTVDECIRDVRSCQWYCQQDETCWENCSAGLDQCVACEPKPTAIKSDKSAFRSRVPVVGSTIAKNPTESAPTKKSGDDAEFWNLFEKTKKTTSSSSKPKRATRCCTIAGRKICGNACSH